VPVNAVPDATVPLTVKTDGGGVLPPSPPQAESHEIARQAVSKPGMRVKYTAISSLLKGLCSTKFGVEQVFFDANAAGSMLG
jgi:hypothetical protein